MAAATVTVACKLPHGLVMETVAADGSRQEVRVNGARLPLDGKGRERRVFEQEGAYGLTPNVPADFWEKWSRDNAAYPPLARGMIFAQGRKPDAEAQARELDGDALTITGLEPLNPDGDRRTRGLSAVSRFDGKTSPA